MSRWYYLQGATTFASASAVTDAVRLSRQPSSSCDALVYPAPVIVAAGRQFDQPPVTHV